jgi:uncharacterized protein
MRVGLISDTHGDASAWERALASMGDVELILHAGDVLYHGVFNPILETYEPKRLAGLLNDIAVPTLHARGNCDSEVDQMALDSPILSEFACARVDGRTVVVNHGHRYEDPELAGMASGGGHGIVLRGHTHVPGLSWTGGVLVINAGSPSLPKQEPPLPTAGVMDQSTVKIFEIDSGTVLMSEDLPGTGQAF